ncbi:hypothetical protein Taro_047655 [Colocasia esculenta]|uniref:Uncharacterized protein n=1 Tax=Colocasia esculenta TaxID=4460 RepID=A0A843X7Z6_COLES|nr:hypothetical protein [Colocasia esculenta]
MSSPIQANTKKANLRREISSSTLNQVKEQSQNDKSQEKISNQVVEQSQKDKSHQSTIQSNQVIEQGQKDKFQKEKCQDKAPG